MSITELDRTVWIDDRIREGERRIAAAVTEVAVDALHRTLALLGLLLLLPVFAAVALAIAVDSPGSPLFRQVRVGRDGREFVMFKFRTMRADAESLLEQLLHLNERDGLLFKIRNDPRVSRVGYWLRRFSIDELPQLWNVVRGDMALVGPRPPLPREVAHYDVVTRRRLDVKPGVTGIWQVSGRSDLSWDEAIRLDLTYVEERSLLLDLQILVRTAGAVVRGTGAY